MPLNLLANLRAHVNVLGSDSHVDVSIYNRLLAYTLRERNHSHHHHPHSAPAQGISKQTSTIGASEEEEEQRNSARKAYEMGIEHLYQVRSGSVPLDKELLLSFQQKIDQVMPDVVLYTAPRKPSVHQDANDKETEEGEAAEAKASGVPEASSRAASVASTAQRGASRTQVSPTAKQRTSRKVSSLNASGVSREEEQAEADEVLQHALVPAEVVLTTTPAHVWSHAPGASSSLPPSPPPPHGGSTKPVPILFVYELPQQEQLLADRYNGSSAGGEEGERASQLGFLTAFWKVVAAALARYYQSNPSAPHVSDVFVMWSVPDVHLLQIFNQSIMQHPYAQKAAAAAHGEVAVHLTTASLHLLSMMYINQSHFQDLTLAYKRENDSASPKLFNASTMAAIKGSVVGGAASASGAPGSKKGAAGGAAGTGSTTSVGDNVVGTQSLLSLLKLIFHEAGGEEEKEVRNDVLQAQKQLLLNAFLFNYCDTFAECIVRQLQLQHYNWELFEEQMRFFPSWAQKRVSSLLSCSGGGTTSSGEENRKASHARTASLAPLAKDQLLLESDPGNMTNNTNNNNNNNNNNNRLSSGNTTGSKVVVTEDAAGSSGGAAMGNSCSLSANLSPQELCYLLRSIPSESNLFPLLSGSGAAPSSPTRDAGAGGSKGAEVAAGKGGGAAAASAKAAGGAGSKRKVSDSATLASAAQQLAAALQPLLQQAQAFAAHAAMSGSEVESVWTILRLTHTSPSASTDGAAAATDTTGTADSGYMQAIDANKEKILPVMNEIAKLVSMYNDWRQQHIFVPFGEKKMESCKQIKGRKDTASEKSTSTSMFSYGVSEKELRDQTAASILRGGSKQKGVAGENDHKNDAIYQREKFAMVNSFSLLHALNALVSQTCFNMADKAPLRLVKLLSHSTADAKEGKDQNDLMASLTGATWTTRDKAATLVGTGGVALTPHASRKTHEVASPETVLKESAALGVRIEESSEYHTSSRVAEDAKRKNASTPPRPRVKFRAYTVDNSWLQSQQQEGEKRSTLLRSAAGLLATDNYFSASVMKTQKKGTSQLGVAETIDGATARSAHEGGSSTSAATEKQTDPATLVVVPAHATGRRPAYEPYPEEVTYMVNQFIQQYLYGCFDYSRHGAGDTITAAPAAAPHGAGAAADLVIAFHANKTQYYQGMLKLKEWLGGAKHEQETVLSMQQKMEALFERGFESFVTNVNDSKEMGNYFSLQSTALPSVTGHAEESAEPSQQQQQQPQKPCLRAKDIYKLCAVPLSNYDDQLQRSVERSFTQREREHVLQQIVLTELARGAKLLPAIDFKTFAQYRSGGGTSGAAGNHNNQKLLQLQFSSEPFAIEELMTYSAAVGHMLAFVNRFGPHLCTVVSFQEDPNQHMGGGAVKLTSSYSKQAENVYPPRRAVQYWVVGLTLPSPRDGGHSDAAVLTADAARIYDRQKSLLWLHPLSFPGIPSIKTLVKGFRWASSVEAHAQQERQQQEQQLLQLQQQQQKGLPRRKKKSAEGGQEGAGGTGAAGPVNRLGNTYYAQLLKQYMKQEQLLVHGAAGPASAAADVRHAVEFMAENRTALYPFCDVVVEVTSTDTSRTCRYIKANELTAALHYSIGRPSAAPAPPAAVAGQDAGAGAGSPQPAGENSVAIYFSVRFDDGILFTCTKDVYNTSPGAIGRRSPKGSRVQRKSSHKLSTVGADSVGDHNNKSAHNVSATAAPVAAAGGKKEKTAKKEKPPAAAAGAKSAAKPGTSAGNKKDNSHDSVSAPGEEETEAKSPLHHPRRDSSSMARASMVPPVSSTGGVRLWQTEVAPAATASVSAATSKSAKEAAAAAAKESQRTEAEDYRKDALKPLSVSLTSNNFVFEAHDYSSVLSFSYFGNPQNLNCTHNNYHPSSAASNLSSLTETVYCVHRSCVCCTSLAHCVLQPSHETEVRRTLDRAYGIVSRYFASGVVQFLFPDGSVLTRYPSALSPRSSAPHEEAEGPFGRPEGAETDALTCYDTLTVPSGARYVRRVCLYEDSAVCGGTGVVGGISGEESSGRGRPTSNSATPVPGENPNHTDSSSPISEEARQNFDSILRPSRPPRSNSPGSPWNHLSIRDFVLLQSSASSDSAAPADILPEAVNNTGSGALAMKANYDPLHSCYSLSREDGVCVAFYYHKNGVSNNNNNNNNSNTNTNNGPHASVKQSMSVLLNNRTGMMESTPMLNRTQGSVSSVGNNDSVYARVVLHADGTTITTFFAPHPTTDTANNNNNSAQFVSPILLPLLRDAAAVTESCGEFARFCVESARMPRVFLCPSTESPPAVFYASAAAESPTLPLPGIIPSTRTRGGNLAGTAGATAINNNNNNATTNNNMMNAANTYYFGPQNQFHCYYAVFGDGTVLRRSLTRRSAPLSASPAQRRLHVALQNTNPNNTNTNTAAAVTAAASPSFYSTTQQQTSSTSAAPAALFPIIMETNLVRPTDSGVRVMHDINVVILEPADVATRNYTNEAALAIGEGFPMFDLALGGMRLVDYKACVTEVQHLFPRSRYSDDVTAQLRASTWEQLLRELVNPQYTPHRLPGEREVAMETQRTASDALVRDELRRHGLCPLFTQRLRVLAENFIVERNLLKSDVLHRLIARRALLDTKTPFGGAGSHPATATAAATAPSSAGKTDDRTTSLSTSGSAASVKGGGPSATQQYRNHQMTISEHCENGIPPLFFTKLVNGEVQQFVCVEQLHQTLREMDAAEALPVFLSRSVASGEPGTQQLTLFKSTQPTPEDDEEGAVLRSLFSDERSGGQAGGLSTMGGGVAGGGLLNPSRVSSASYHGRGGAGGAGGKMAATSGTLATLHERHPSFLKREYARLLRSSRFYCGLTGAAGYARQQAGGAGGNGSATNNNNASPEVAAVNRYAGGSSRWLPSGLQPPRRFMDTKLYAKHMKRTLTDVFAAHANNNNNNKNAAAAGTAPQNASAEQETPERIAGLPVVMADENLVPYDTNAYNSIQSNSAAIPISSHCELLRIFLQFEPITPAAANIVMQSELHRHAQLQELTTYYHNAKDSFPQASAEAQAEQQRLQEVYHSMRKKHKQQKLQKMENDEAGASGEPTSQPRKKEDKV